MTISRRRLLITVPLIALFLAIVTGFFINTAEDLRVRSAKLSLGMTRPQVEQVLGKPALSLNRTQDRGLVLVWVDQLWQLDVIFDKDGFVESLGTKPSDSEYRRTMARINKWFK